LYTPLVSRRRGNPVALDGNARRDLMQGGTARYNAEGALAGDGMGERACVVSGRGRSGTGIAALGGADAPLRDRKERGE